MLAIHVIVVCGGGYGKYLKQAVESVMANDAEFALTIVDDNSTDETPEVARALRQRYPKINYMRNERNITLAASRNRGIEQIDSKYVICLDADDCIGPNYLNAAMHLLESGCDIANPDAILFERERGRWPATDNVTLPMLLERNRLICAAAFRRSYWEKVGGYDEALHYWEDYDIWVRMVEKGARVRSLPGDHFYHRRHISHRSMSENVPQAKARLDLRKRFAHLYRGKVSVAIMAHHKRKYWVDGLLEHVPGATVVWDKYNDRCETGRRSLLAHDPEATHHMVIQDDTILCNDLLAGINQAVLFSRAHPVGLYIGASKRYSLLADRTRRNGQCWFITKGPWWGPGIVIPTQHISELVKWSTDHPEIQNYDMQVGKWYSNQRIWCWYTVPSLVDHRPVIENPSLIPDRTKDRRAHYFIGQQSALEIPWETPPHRMIGYRDSETIRLGDNVPSLKTQPSAQPLLV